MIKMTWLMSRFQKEAKKLDFGVNSYLQVISIIPEEYYVLADILCITCDSCMLLRNENTW